MIIAGLFMFWPVFAFERIVGTNYPTANIIFFWVWLTISGTSCIVTLFTDNDSIGEYISGLFSNLLWILSL